MFHVKRYYVNLPNPLKGRLPKINTFSSITAQIPIEPPHARELMWSMARQDITSQHYTHTRLERERATPLRYLVERVIMFQIVGKLHRRTGHLGIYRNMAYAAASSADRHDDHDPLARLKEAATLAGQISRPAVQKLLDYLGDEHPLVRWQAGIALAETASRLRRRARLGMPTWDRHAPELSFSGLLLILYRGLHDPDPRRRAATADALALWGHEAAVSYLIEALTDSDPTVRLSAASGLGKLRDRAAIEPLTKALEDPSLWVRRAAVDALGAIADPKAVPALQKALSDPEHLVRAGAVCALGHMESAKARDLLRQIACDGDAALRWYAARSLGYVGDVGALPVLQRLQDDHTVFFGRSTAEVATEALVAIKRRCFGPWNAFRKAFGMLRHRLEKRR